MSRSPLRVAVVDDSSFVRKAIERMFLGDRRVRIVGLAASGEELLAHLDDWRPEVVTLDLSMPGIGGLQTLDILMAQRPTPVIILSTHSAKDAPLTIEALHRGAMDFIDKGQYSLVDFEALREVILEKLLSVRSASLTAAVEAEERPKEEEPDPEPRAAPSAVAVSPHFDVLAIGASTGGPPTIQRILEDLGSSVPVPTVVVQHMPAGFTRAFAERLNTHLPLQVREATHGEPLLPATVYIAPAGRQLLVERQEDGRLTLSLQAGAEDARHTPSVDVLFDSAAEAAGKKALAVLLTGMGSDGAKGMQRISKAGGMTLSQDESSCVVFGMPKAAQKLGAVKEVVALDRLGGRLLELLREGRGAG